MKVIALLPFRNEEWCLPSYLHNTTKIVDEIIAIDDGSIDSSAKILEDAGAKVYSSEKLIKFNSGWSEGSIRAELLKLGREAGGTHFVCLDADETFTNPLVENFQELIPQLQPGEKMSLQWLALWKSYSSYRHDATVWSNNWKDFVVCDDPSLSYNHNQHMHVGRTPVSVSDINNESWRRLENEHGAVMHFQFSAYNNFQLKQCWLRCSELIQEPHNFQGINIKYSITLLEQNVGLEEMPKSWYDGIVLPKVENFDPEWKDSSFVRADLLPGIYKYFEDYGVEFFENLNIWHVPQLRNYFIKQTGRMPR
tara:strand:- start:602 stop:1528 length:927 start_codon:yes stop_codon:yes gene_type:complete